MNDKVSENKIDTLCLELIARALFWYAESIFTCIGEIYFLVSGTNGSVDSSYHICLESCLLINLFKFQLHKFLFLLLSCA